MNWNWKLTTAEQELVEKNIGWVRSVIKHRFSRCIDMELNDLIQTGFLGLMSAAHFYLQRDMTQINFATFAWPRISSHIKDTLNCRQINKRLAIAIQNFITSTYQSQGQNINVREIALHFRITECELRLLLIENAGFENLDTAIKDSEKSLSFIDDRLSPLDLAILKEEHLLKEAKAINKRTTKVKRLRKEMKAWMFNDDL